MSEHHTKAADDEKESEVSAIIDWAGESADKKDH